MLGKVIGDSVPRLSLGDKEMHFRFKHTGIIQAGHRDPYKGPQMTPLAPGQP